MRRAIAIAAVLGSSACSLLFNPDNAPLAKCDPPPSVSPFEAQVGDRTSLTWLWPNAAPDAGPFKEWEVCWGPSEAATTRCKTIPSKSCTTPQCSLTVDGADAGFAYNTRVFGKITAHDACKMNADTLATASATPINGTFLDTQGITLSTTCDAGLHTDGSGVLVFDELTNFACLSTAMMGDDNWRDATIDLEVRVFGDSYAGLAVRVPSGGTTNPRNGAIISASRTVAESAALTRRLASGADVIVASSGAPVVLDATWSAMRLVMRDQWISVSLGSTQAELREAIRWHDPNLQVPSGQLGVALAVVGLFNVPGRVELRNLRVRTGAVVPDGGPQRDAWTFSGLDALHALRRVNTTSVVGCPGYTGACSTCTPDAGSQCFEITSNGFATVEVPIGIDYSKPWRVSFKYAADPAGAPNDPAILRTTVVGPTSDAFGGFPIIDTTGFNWAQPLRAFGDNAQGLGSLTAGQWSSFDVIFDSSTSTYTINRNGSLARMSGTPQIGPHLGALILGGGGNSHAYFTDLEIAQPP